MAIAIDTLEYARLLIDAGVEQKQAEVQASFLNKTLKEHVPSKEELQNNIEQAKTELATKSGVDRSIETAKIEINAKIDKLDAKVDKETSELKSDMKLMKWMLGFQFAMILAIFTKLFIG